MAKKLIGKIAIVDGKYGDKILVKIVGTKNYGKLLQTKDVYGNKYEFGKEEVEIIEKMTDEILYPFIIKDIIKEDMVIDVKEEDMPKFFEMVALAGYTTKNHESYGGTFYLSNGGIYHNAKTEKTISFTTLMNRIYHCGAIAIEEDMVDEFNRMLALSNSAIELKFVKDNDRDCAASTNSKCEIVLKNTTFVEKSIVTPINRFYKILEDFFKDKGITEIHYNNTRTTFWSAVGYSKRYFYFEE